MKKLKTSESGKKPIYSDVIVVVAALFGLSVLFRLWPIAVLLLTIEIVVVVLGLISKVIGQKTEKQTDNANLRSATSDIKVDYLFDIISSIDIEVEKTYPDAKWHWRQSNVLKRIKDSESVSIVLNKNGEYKTATVVIEDFRFIRLEYNDNVVCLNKKENSTVINNDDSLPINYELMAYEWVESKILDINERFNEAIGKGESSFVLNESELPRKESWPLVCEQLQKQGIENVQVCDFGIEIKTKGSKT